MGSNPTPSALRTRSAPAPSPGPVHAGGRPSPRPICGPARGPVAWSRRGIPGRRRLLVRLLRPAAAARPRSGGDHRAGRRAPAIAGPSGWLSCGSRSTPRHIGSGGGVPDDTDMAVPQCRGAQETRLEGGVKGVVAVVAGRHCGERVDLGVGDIATDDMPDRAGPLLLRFRPQLTFSPFGSTRTAPTEMLAAWNACHASRKHGRHIGSTPPNGSVGVATTRGASHSPTSPKPRRV